MVRGQEDKLAPDIRWERMEERRAKLYGVHSIPRPILLDRETRVYTPNARGKELDQALAEPFAFQRFRLQDSRYNKLPHQ